MDETYVKVNGVWRYVYRAIDQDGQVIDVLVSTRRDAATARRFFHQALVMLKVTPSEVVTDAAPIYPAVLNELIPSAWHHAQRHANNPIEADHSQLTHRLRPMRGLRTDRTAQVIIAGHAFLQNQARYTTARHSMKSTMWANTMVPGSRRLPRLLRVVATGAGYARRLPRGRDRLRGARSRAPDRSAAVLPAHRRDAPGGDHPAVAGSAHVPQLGLALVGRERQL